MEELERGSVTVLPWAGYKGVYSSESRAVRMIDKFWRPCYLHQSSAMDSDAFNTFVRGTTATCEFVSTLCVILFEEINPDFQVLPRPSRPLSTQQRNSKTLRSWLLLQP